MAWSGLAPISIRHERSIMHEPWASLCKYDAAQDQICILRPVCGPYIRCLYDFLVVQHIFLSAHHTSDWIRHVEVASPLHAIPKGKV